jgi:hypothetical protein
MNQTPVVEAAVATVTVVVAGTARLLKNIVVDIWAS